MLMVLHVRSPGLLAGLGYLLVDSIRIDKYVCLYLKRKMRANKFHYSEETNPAHDQIPLRPLHSRQDKVLR
jgi:hypothetical protein